MCLLEQIIYITDVYIKSTGQNNNLVQKLTYTWPTLYSVLCLLCQRTDTTLNKLCWMIKQCTFYGKCPSASTSDTSYLKVIKQDKTTEWTLFKFITSFPSEHRWHFQGIKHLHGFLLSLWFHWLRILSQHLLLWPVGCLVSVLMDSNEIIKRKKYWRAQPDQIMDIPHLHMFV